MSDGPGLLAGGHVVALTYSYFFAQYHRIAARRGSKRAILALAHSIPVTIYHMLTRRTSFLDLGNNFFDKRHREKASNKAIHRIERLGPKVTIQPARREPVFS